MNRYNASETGLIHLSRDGDLCLWKDVEKLQEQIAGYAANLKAENKRLKVENGKLRAAVVRKVLMKDKSVTGKC